MPELTQAALMERIDALTLPDEARIWMHTANRLLTDKERVAVDRHLSSFVASWAAHGTPLKAEFGILLNQVVVLAVDETQQVVTGCSIDGSVAALRAINGVLPSLADLDLFDRGWVVHAPVKPDKPWQRTKLHEFWAMRKAGILHDDSSILDTTVTTLGELRTKGVKPLGDSWHAQIW